MIHSLLQWVRRRVAHGQLGTPVATDQRGRWEAPRSTSPGWYPDPVDDGSLRYWDGAQWTKTSRPR